jgi:hypothetical protein
MNSSFGDVTTGINHIKVFVDDQILIGICFKGFEWSWYFEWQTEHSVECKMISGCDMTCVSTKIEDGGHFIPFDQSICRSKQVMKKR